MNIPSYAKPKPIVPTKAFLAIEDGHYYIDTPEGAHITEQEWYKNHDIFDMIEWPRD